MPWGHRRAPFGGRPHQSLERHPVDFGRRRGHDFKRTAHQADGKFIGVFERLNRCRTEYLDQLGVIAGDGRFGKRGVLPQLPKRGGEGRRDDQSKQQSRFRFFSIIDDDCDELQSRYP
jgi:hypothetical protein